MDAEHQLHAGEIDTGPGLVRRLLVAQLPRLPGGAAAVEREHRMLPRLAPLLPLPIPVPVAKGAPADGYPQPWSVYRWLDGEPAWPVLDSFRAGVGYDDATWERGRGWALCFAVVALPYYRDTNPVLAGIARRTIDELLADR